jgi:hypothetical protein
MQMPSKKQKPLPPPIEDRLRVRCFAEPHRSNAFRQRFLHVPGVKKVDIVGEQQERIFVEFSYSRLTMLGISPADIFSALARQNYSTLL